MGDRSAVDAAIVQSEKQEIQQRPIMEAPERSKVFQEPSYKRGAVPPNLVITDIDEDKILDEDDSKTPISVRVENGSNFFYNPR